jgi:thiamine pyrophosphate-dependent acetolactate synthase large subunit-like protein
MTRDGNPMHAGEAVAEAISQEGVRAVYSVPGSHIHPIYDGLSRVARAIPRQCREIPSASPRP